METHLLKRLSDVVALIIDILSATEVLTAPAKQTKDYTQSQTEWKRDISTAESTDMAHSDKAGHPMTLPRIR
jgi:hypothetical protein